MIHTLQFNLSEMQIFFKEQRLTQNTNVSISLYQDYWRKKTTFLSKLTKSRSLDQSFRALLAGLEGRGGGPASSALVVVAVTFLLPFLALSSFLNSLAQRHRTLGSEVHTSELHQANPASSLSSFWDVRRNPGGQDPLQSLLLCPHCHCLQLEDQPRQKST